MLTMYILCLKYVCIYTGPETTTTFERQWRIKPVEKDTYINKIQASPVVSTDDIIGSYNKTFLAKPKTATNHIIPGFT
jgi:hypothetical protein